MHRDKYGIARSNTATGLGRRKFLLLAGGATIAGMYSLSVRNSVPAYLQSPQFRGGRFFNSIARPERGFFESAGLWRDFLFNKPDGTVPDQIIPVHPITQASLLAAPDKSVWRLGHSSLLFKMNAKYWLTDPVFSDRASPVQWFGPKRFHAPPIGLDDVPPIETVIVSHNHYDHLDYSTIMALHHRVKHFITPKGVGAILVSWGVPAAKVHELDWWEHSIVDDICVTATPAQHFSGRGIGDSNRTLWASWVIRGLGMNLFFSGDSGYFDGFRQIGNVFGPFDIAFLETGAYNKRWEYVHMLPAQTAQAFQDLRGKWLFPIHNGTFDLAMHTWNDPLERITHLATERDIALCTPTMGERISLLSPHCGRYWWRKAEP